MQNKVQYILKERHFFGGVIETNSIRVEGKTLTNKNLQVKVKNNLSCYPKG